MSDRRHGPRRNIVYRSKVYSYTYLSGITGKSAATIQGWERRGILEFMLDQTFKKIGVAP